jgi:hypothetical protein
LQLQTAGTTALTIDTSQNVGIGTTSPANVLQAAKSQTADTAIVVSNAGTANAATTMSFVLAESTTPQGWFRRYRDGTGFTEIGYSDVLTFTGNVETTKAERMRIASDGKVMFNTSSVLNAGYMSLLFDGSAINGFTIKNSSVTFGPYLYFVNSAGNVAGYVIQNGTTTVSYTTSSDYRLKENIVPMTGALDKVLQLKPVNYTWKEDGSDGQGFIAHELQAVVPDAVVGEKDAVDEEGNIKPQGVDTSFLVATLTAAIQEQQTIINDLKARITALEGAA